MNEAGNPVLASRGSISWPLLLALGAVIVGTASLMARNTFYTEGEAVEVLYLYAVRFTGLLLLIGFFNRNLAAWLVVALGGGLILWQANQTRRWGILHEEVLAIVAHATKEKREKGSFPDELEGYVFLHPELREQVFYSSPGGKLYIGYHLNDPSISYWYQEDTGFGYYPD